MSFHIQLRVNLVKSRKQISKHQNQGYWKFCSKNQRKKHKCRTVLVPKCLTQVTNCTGAELSWCRNISHRCRSVLVPHCPGAEVSSIPLTHIYITTQILLPWMKGGGVNIPFLIKRCGHASAFHM